MKRKRFFYEQNLKLTSNNTFNNGFCSRIFPHYRFIPVLKQLLDFHESWLLFRGKYSLQFYYYQFLK